MEEDQSRKSYASALVCTWLAKSSYGLKLTYLNLVLSISLHYQGLH